MVYAMLHGGFPCPTYTYREADAQAVDMSRLTLESSIQPHCQHLALSNLSRAM